MTKSNGSSSPAGTKARFFPLHPQTLIRILIEPAKGGKGGKKNRVIRPESASPFVRTPLRIRNFGPVYACLMNSENIPSEAVTVDWPAQIWLAQGWFHQGQLLRRELDIVSGGQASDNPLLILSLDAGLGERRNRATHNIPENESGKIIFPQATFGR